MNTQADVTTTTQAADAILALINSRPRTPTRDEIMGALAKFRPKAVNDNDSGGGGRTFPIRLTDLGRNLLSKLPEFGEAVYYASNLCDIPRMPGYDAANVRAVNARETASSDAISDALDAILEAPAETHLGDLALACSHLNIRDHVPNDHQIEVVEAITGALLKAIGVTPQQCDAQTYYEDAQRRIETTCRTESAV